MSRFRGSYPPDWPLVSRRVKEEAVWRCVRCGHPDPPLRGQRGHAPCDEWCLHEPDDRRRVLTVHHFDDDKSNGRWWNLGALCQVCHLEFQGKVVLAQAYLHEHSTWFKPYVAGYYAFVVLGEELTRVEVEDRLEELLTAGQPWRASA